jgi:hypothetical protein
MCEKSEKFEGELLVAERKAIIQALDRVFAANNVQPKECFERIALACVSLGAEMWARLHPELPAEDLANIYSGMSREAILGYFDAHVIVFAQRTIAKRTRHA